MERKKKKKILIEINEIDDRIFKIINMGLAFSLIVGILGILLLHTYNTYPVSYDFYKGGLILIKTSFVFSAQFIASGFITDKLLKGKI